MVGMVGNTRPCRDRCTEHRGAVNNNRDTAVGEHFNRPGHGLEDLVFLPIEKVHSRDPFVIEARERFWIQKYGVLHRNEQEDMNTTSLLGSVLKS